MGAARAIRDGYGEALLELGRSNGNVVVLDADLAESTRSSVFRKEFPERFFNAGIAEQNMVNMAVGLALSGKTVFASSFAIFATGRCWEQLRNSVAATRANVKIVASHGGLTVGPDGLSHQCVEDISLCVPSRTSPSSCRATGWRRRRRCSPRPGSWGPSTSGRRGPRLRRSRARRRRSLSASPCACATAKT